MSDAFTSYARDQRGVLERLIKGLPGISGYTDKELRRNADYRLRQLIGDELDRQRAGMMDVQSRLLKSGGLSFLDELDVAVTRTQTLADRIRTASYGYAGFFDAVRVRQEELDALHRFDVALMQHLAGLDAATASLRDKAGDPAAVGGAIDAVVSEVTTLSTLFDRRGQAIVSPELLTSTGYAPDVRADGGLYDLSPADSATAADYTATITPAAQPPAPSSVPPAPVASSPVAPAAAPAPAEPMVDAGNYTLTPSSDAPGGSSSAGDVPSGFELIDKP
jgi:hypothetical protein